MNEIHIDQARLFQTISLAVEDATREVLTNKQADRITELEQEVEQLRDDSHLEQKEIDALWAVIPKPHREASVLEAARREVEQLHGERAYWKSAVETARSSAGVAELTRGVIEAQDRFNQLVKRLERIPRHVVSPSEFRQIGDSHVVRADELEAAITDAKKAGGG